MAEECWEGHGRKTDPGRGRQPSPAALTSWAAPWAAPLQPGLPRWPLPPPTAEAPPAPRDHRAQRGTSGTRQGGGPVEGEGKKEKRRVLGGRKPWEARQSLPPTSILPLPTTFPAHAVLCHSSFTAQHAATTWWVEVMWEERCHHRTIRSIMKHATQAGSRPVAAHHPVPPIAFQQTVRLGFPRRHERVCAGATSAGLTCRAWMARMLARLADS